MVCQGNEMAAPRPSQLLTPKDLAQLLRCHPGHVYRLTRLRQVPFIKIKGSIRFRPESIERWIMGQEVVSVGDILRKRGR